MHTATASGRWETTKRRGPETTQVYILNGHRAGTVLELGLFRAIATIEDRAGRRHQRPFPNAIEARHWVEENQQHAA